MSGSAKSATRVNKRTIPLSHQDHLEGGGQYGERLTSSIVASRIHEEAVAGMNESTSDGAGIAEGPVGPARGEVASRERCWCLYARRQIEVEQLHRFYESAITFESR